MPWSVRIIHGLLDSLTKSHTPNPSVLDKVNLGDYAPLMTMFRSNYSLYLMHGCCTWSIHTEFTEIPVVRTPFTSNPGGACSISLSSNEACWIYMEMLMGQIAKNTPKGYVRTYAHSISATQSVCHEFYNATQATTWDQSDRLKLYLEVGSRSIFKGVMQP